MKGDEISNDQRILAGIFSNDLNAIIHQLYTSNIAGWLSPTSSPTRAASRTGKTSFRRP
jgi:ribosomal protein L4